MDIFDYLCNISKESIIMFNKLKQSADINSGITILNVNSFNASEETTLHKSIKELINNGIICSLHQDDVLYPIEENSYIINPNLVRPIKFDEAKILWDKITCAKD